jgi:hypothetical protein
MSLDPARASKSNRNNKTKQQTETTKHKAGAAAAAAGRTFVERGLHERAPPVGHEAVELPVAHPVLLGHHPPHAPRQRVLLDQGVHPGALVRLLAVRGGAGVNHAAHQHQVDQPAQAGALRVPA